MKLARRSRGGAMIPTASMSDIAFLLLLFFMVTTVFAVSGLDVRLPKAKKWERIRLNRNMVSVWVDEAAQIMVDDKLVPDRGVFEDKIREKLAANPDIIVLLRIDENARYGLIGDMIQSLREIEALKISFATLAEGTK